MAERPKGLEAKLELAPVSSLDLVDSYLDVDDHLQKYLMSLNDVNVQENVANDRNLPTVNPATGQMNVNVNPNPDSLPAHYPQFAQSLAGMDFGGGLMGSAGLGGSPLPPADMRMSLGDAGVPAGDFVFQGQPDNKSSAESGSRERTGAGGARAKKRRGSDSLEFEDLSAEKKQQVMQEKNRLAQRRFRERQKAKVQDLHKQIEDLKQKVDSLQLENSSLQSQNSILEKVLSMRDEQINVMQEESKILDVSCEQDKAAEKACSGSLTLSALKGREVTITCDMLKKMAPEEVMQLWQTYVTEISAALVDANSNSPKAVARVEQLINEICMLCMRFAVLNPISCRVWHARQYHLSEADELKKWQTIMATLDLLPEQKMEIVQLRKMLLQKLQNLVDERRKLNLTIQPTLPSSTVGHRIALEYLKANQAVVRLKMILRAEHNAMLDFVSTSIKKVLKPLQVARLMVQAYPAKPDLLAVASAVAIDQGEDVSVPPPPNALLPPLLEGPSSSALTQLHKEQGLSEGAWALMGCGNGGGGAVGSTDTQVVSPVAGVGGMTGTGLDSIGETASK